jgi:hypothetical protein
MFLLKKELDDNVTFNNGPNNEYEGSNLQSYFTGIYYSNIYPSINANALIPDLGDHSSSSAVSLPTNVLASSAYIGENIYFAMSYRDVINKLAIMNSKALSLRWWLRTKYGNSDNFIYYVMPSVVAQGIIIEYADLNTAITYNARPAVWVRYTQTFQ